MSQFSFSRYQVTPGVNKKPGFFTADSFRNFHLWQIVSEFFRMPQMDSLKNSGLVRHTVSEYPIIDSFRFCWTNIHPWVTLIPCFNTAKWVRDVNFKWTNFSFFRNPARSKSESWISLGRGEGCESLKKICEKTKKLGSD